MKKIKGLLLFGILTLLGIGSSFSQFYDLDDSNGSQLILPHIYTQQGYLYVDYLYGESVYTSTRFVWDRFLSANAHIPVNACLNSSAQIVGFSSNSIAFGNNTSCSSSITLWNPVSSSDVFFPYLYISSPANIFPYSVRTSGSISYFIYFDNTTFYTNYGDVVDVPDGYSRKNLFLNNVGNYGIVSTNSSGDYFLSSIGQDSFNVTETGGVVYDFDLYVYSGLLILHFNDYSSSYYTGNSTIVLSIGSGEVFYNLYTGFYNGIKEINYYGVYPYKVGLLAYNNNTGTAYSSFINDVLGGGSIILTAGSDVGGIFFTAYSYSQPYASSDLNRVWVTKTTSTLFTFQDDDSVPIFITPSGNGTQSTGSIAINTGLINLCLTSPSFYALNTIFCDRVFGGRDLSYVQGLISSGAYLQSYVDGSGNLVYVVDITDEPGVLTGGVVWECYGDRCINSESGSWGDVEPWEILHLSGGDILSSGYYLGFFESINETGYFFKCPYSYNNSRWVAGRSILNAIGRDPFLPINCFIAAYENGRRVKLFDEAFNGYSWGPLMNGDTQNHKNLFTFFDILLSVALIFFLMKFYHLFK